METASARRGDDTAYLTISEVAQRLRVSARWLADECRAGRVEHIHLARQRRFTPDQVASLIARHTVRPEADVKLDAARARALRSIGRRRSA